MAHIAAPIMAQAPLNFESAKNITISLVDKPSPMMIDNETEISANPKTSANEFADANENWRSANSAQDGQLDSENVQG
jgi:hypothetical protein